MEKSVDLILPAHNESGNIIPIHREILDALEPMGYAFQMIFVDDGSTDDTLDIIRALAAADSRVKFVSLSRNFGHQNAIKAGLDFSTAKIVIMMDCDMQHPPEMVSVLLKEYESGYDIVRTHRLEVEHTGFFKRKTSNLFYRILNKFSDIQLEKGSADFRLVSGKALEHLKSFSEMDLFYRGLIKWIGFSQVSIAFEPRPRTYGETKYSFTRMVSLGLRGFTSFSTKPLYFSAYIGMMVSIASLLYIPYVVYALVYGHAIAGWASAIVTIAFFGGLNLMILGIIGIYLSKLFAQSKDRPHYIVKGTNL
jgi:dolichol-phosphate mannosyltransferase